MNEDSKLMAVMLTACGALLLLIGAAVYFGIQDERAWESYVTEHRCSVVSTRAGHIRQTNGYVGGKIAHGTTYEPGETCWSCEPGPLGVEVCR